MKFLKIILLLAAFALADSTFISTYITTNYFADVKEKSNPTFALDQGVLGITDVMNNNLTANLYFRIYKNIYAPYIEAGNVSIGKDLKFTLGQQFYNYGYMITRMATYPLLTDHIWTQQPGANLTYIKNSNVFGVSLLTKPRVSDSALDYLSVLNYDYTGFGFTRLSAKISQDITELDFYHEITYKMLGFDFEVYNNFEVDGQTDKSGGYYIDFFVKNKNKTYSLRFDALTDNYLRDIRTKEYSVAYTVDLNDEFWIIGQYSYNDLKKNTIYLQLGYWRNITFLRK